MLILLKVSCFFFISKQIPQIVDDTCFHNRCNHMNIYMFLQFISGYACALILVSVCPCELHYNRRNFIMFGMF
jgi:hypothetical protein